MQDLWIHTNEAEDVAASIRHALVCIRLTKDDDQAWKWVMLSLHAALQGACVCHLTTTAAPLGAVTKKNAVEWIDYFDKKTALVPKTRLMSMPDLLRAVRKVDSAGSGFTRSPIAISDSELAWLNRIHDEFRNQFIHFSPTGWSFEVSGVPKMSQLIARIIDDISSCGWAFRHLEAAKRENMNENLKLLSGMESWKAR